MIQNLTPKELEYYLKTTVNNPLLLDVRESWEYERCQIGGSEHLPMTQLLARFQELDPVRETIVVCHHGVRSWRVATYLAGNGFDNVKNLTSGIDGWAKDVDNTMPTY